MNNFLESHFLGNTTQAWLIALGIIVISFVAIKIIKVIIIKRLKKWSLKTTTTWDDFLISIIESSIIPLLYVSSVYFSLKTLELNEKASGVIHIAYLVTFTFFILRMISAAFKKFIYSFINRRENSEDKQKQAGGLIAIVNIVIWVLGIIFLIDNMGYNVTTLVAGLGVGGIAIALAAQAVLGDLFSYFVIFFDRPFEIGDFVIIGR